MEMQCAYRLSFIDKLIWLFWIISTTVVALKDVTPTIRISVQYMDVISL